MKSRTTPQFFLILPGGIVLRSVLRRRSAEAHEPDLRKVGQLLLPAIRRLPFLTRLLVLKLLRVKVTCEDGSEISPSVVYCFDSPTSFCFVHDIIVIQRTQMDELNCYSTSDHLISQPLGLVARRIQRQSRRNEKGGSQPLPSRRD